MKEFDVVVVAARYQPVHSRHLAALRTACERGSRVILAMLGADAAPSPASPWSCAERLEQLQQLCAIDPGRIEAVAVSDVPYDLPRWSARLADAVTAVVADAGRIGLLADAAPADLWPRSWIRLTRDAGFAAGEADLRDELLWSKSPEWTRIERQISAAQAAALRQWSAGEACARLREEARFLQDFRARWAVAPYPPVFVTVDGVVTWRDEILLIQRGRAPGRDLWALPGGFLDQHETLATGARREVAEETGLVLAAAAGPGRVFDEPARSLRGRTITHAFSFVLDGDRPRPAVRGADDARAAAWFACASLAPATLFEDHYAILQVMLGLP
ncbi:MAG: NUDIX domain-containing protein [Gammaproteobacteria bacterium]